VIAKSTRRNVFWPPGRDWKLKMHIKVFSTPFEMAQEAASFAASSIRSRLAVHRTVVLLAATGTSQIDFLQNLTRYTSIDWSRVELFHLDEYIGLGIEHPASFARYIRDRLIQPTGINNYHLLDGARDPREVIGKANAEMSSGVVDIAFVGIGENGHLAFNDPPADFEAEDPYLVVELDARCRRQQVNEGRFATLDEVPQRAISMSVKQILKSREIIAIVPDKRKSAAVKHSIEGPIVPSVPASILQRHANLTIFLDKVRFSPGEKDLNPALVRRILEAVRRRIPEQR
jgi:glucosamine-6-phosphate deaminase